MPFPQINYQYWSNRNPFTQNIPLLETIKTCIIHYASMPNLINDVLDQVNDMTCLQLLNTISTDIREVVDDNLFDENIRMLRIFDLIQGWGGKMGKWPYIPFANPTRNNANQWINIYKAGARLAKEGDPNAIFSFMQIPKIGESFASKHVFFWAKYGGNDFQIPIYDKRIFLILFNGISPRPNYIQYVNEIRNFSVVNNIRIEEIEVALFAFSMNYFPASSLIMKQNIEDQTNINIAAELQENYVNGLGNN